MIAVLVAAWFALVVGRTLVVPLHSEWIRLFWWPPQMNGWTVREFGGALARHLRALAGLAAVAAACAGYGAPVRRWLVPRRAGPLRWQVSFLLGEAVAATAVLALGLSTLLFPGLVGMVLVVGAATGGRRLSALAASCRWPAGEFPATAWVATAILVVTAVSLAITAAAPPIYIDHLGYYLADPARFLATHRIGMGLNNPFDGLPRGCEHLAVLALVAGDETTVRGLNVLGLALGLGALAALGRDRGLGRGWWLVTAAAVVSLPVTQLMGMNSFNDWLVLHAALVAAWALARGGTMEAAVLGGWLLSLKYSTVLLALPLLGLAVRRRQGRAPVLLLAAALPVLPAMARDFFAHGQPWYPMFARWWPTFETAAQLDPGSRFDQFAAGLGFRDGIPAWLARGWTGHFGVHREADMTAGLAAPAILLALPVALGNRLGLGRALPAWGWLGWLVLGGGLPRYAYPLGVLAIAEATAVVGRWRNALIGLLVLTSYWQVMQGWSVLYPKADPVAVALGGERPSMYLRRVMTPVPFYMETATESAERFGTGRTYVLGDVKAYYWRGDFILDVLTYKPRLASWIEDSDSPTRIAARFRQANVRHLVYRLEGLVTFEHVAPGAFRWTRDRLAAWQSFWLAHAESRGQRRDLSVPQTYFYFDLVPHARHPWPKPDAPFTLPGTEALTVPGDDLQEAGDRAGARRWFTRCVKNWPGFIVPRHRLAGGA